MSVNQCELMYLRRLYAQMRANVESRSKSPAWLKDTLDVIADARGDIPVKPGSTYGTNVNYSQINIQSVPKDEL